MFVRAARLPRCLLPLTIAAHPPIPCVQRAAMLYGRYEPEPAVPDGTRAVIECVYEPPQKTDGVSVTLLEDPFEPTVQ